MTLSEIERLIENLRYYVETNKPHELHIDYGLTLKLLLALRDYADGTSPTMDHAFGLVRPKHRPKEIDAERLQILADAYEIRYQSGHSEPLSWSKVWTFLDMDDCIAANIKDSDHLRKLIEDTYADEVGDFVTRLFSERLVRRMDRLPNSRFEVGKRANRRRALIYRSRTKAGKPI